MAQIFVAEVNDTFWVRIEGSASLRDSPTVKECLQSAIADGGRSLVVDLEACRSMDSSFMGTLTAIAIQLANREDGAALEIVNAGPRCVDALEELGIDQLLTIDRDGSTYLDERALVARALEETEVDPDRVTKEELAAQSLEAHRALQKANEDNVCRFRDVVDFLEKKAAAKDRDQGSAS